jgi:hypothetical protein
MDVGRRGGALKKQVGMALALCFLAFTAVAACGDSTGRVDARTRIGTLVGTFHIVMGGVAYVDVRGTGHVTVFEGRHRVAGQVVESDASFRFELASGPYVMTSTCTQSPRGETQLSEPKTVVVRSDRVSSVHLTCLLNPTAG